MRFHAQYCQVCKTEKLFLEKLTDVQDPNCSEMEDVCITCKNKFYIKEKKAKLKVRFNPTE